MSDPIGGFLWVGRNDEGEIVIDHPDLKPDENGVGHIVFSPEQARGLALLLHKHAADADRELYDKAEAERRKTAEAMAIPVDRNARVLADGSAVTDDHRELLPSGQQKGYVVLTAAERSKGFVRPVRQSYRHTCGCVTHMSLAIAETYARDPKFYSGTFCVQCAAHFPLAQFTWSGTDEVLGS